MASTSYPTVVRTVDPLVIRVDKLSLLVGDTNFYAKIKTGIHFTGFTVYSSGLGTPIYQKQVSDSGQIEINGKVYNVQTAQKAQNLEEVAKEWLDELEDSFSNIDEDTSIKAAIDRLCWQLHYDLTKTNADMPQDMADVTIDKTAETIYDYTDTLSGGITKIATNIKADSDAYTVSQALRQGSSSKSISEQIAEQQTAISQQLSDVNTSLGLVKNNTDSILTDTTAIKSSASTTATNTGTTATNTRSIATNTNTISGISANVGSIYSKVNNIESDVDNINTKITNTFVTISSGGNNVSAFRTYGSANGW